MILKHILLIFSITFISACTNQTKITTQDAASKLVQVTPKDKPIPLIIEVPSAGNALSNQMIAASLANGTDSNSSQMIRSSLESGKSMAVISKSETVLCATLNRALQNITSISNPNISLTVFGHKEICSSTQTLAKNKGLSFNVITHP